RSRRGARHFPGDGEAPLDAGARVLEEGAQPRMSGADRWQRVGALFDRALATPPPERQSVVRGSSEPADIQDEVLQLLKSHDDSHGFLEPPALLTAGTQVGAYRIERILG